MLCYVIAHKPAINPFRGIPWGKLLDQDTDIKVFIARSEILLNSAPLVLQLPYSSPGPVHSSSLFFFFSIFFFFLIKNQKGKKKQTLNSRKQKLKKCLPGVIGWIWSKDLMYNMVTIFNNTVLNNWNLPRE